MNSHARGSVYSMPRGSQMIDAHDSVQSLEVEMEKSGMARNPPMVST